MCRGRSAPCLDTHRASTRVILIFTHIHTHTRTYARTRSLSRTHARMHAQAHTGSNTSNGCVTCMAALSICRGSLDACVEMECNSLSRYLTCTAASSKCRGSFYLSGNILQYMPRQGHLILRADMHNIICMYDSITCTAASSMPRQEHVISHIIGIMLSHV